METSLYSVSHEVAESYIISQFDGWGNLVNYMCGQHNYGKGHFFCFSSQKFESRVLEFQYSKQYEYGNFTPFPQDIMSEVMCLYLNSPLQRNTIVENPAIDQQTMYLLTKATGDVYLSNNVYFFALGRNCSKDDADSFLDSHTGNWGFNMFFTSASLENLKQHTNIPLASEREIKENISAFFIQIYDDESFLFWIRDDETVLKQIIDNTLVKQKTE